ncbi:MAG: DUF2461 domain-containing protein [Planctomycetota bacterium]|jgi:uncharacterized protein (TIGR02453 family)
MFTRRTIAFLKDLEKNNSRDWFLKNKSRYEEDALGPFLEFIRAMQPRLEKISPHILCSDKKVGGAMMRLNRDVRFSKDKSPYAPRLAARFVHAKGKKGGAPGYYINIGPKRCMLGTGVWRPDTKFVGQIRNHIVKEPKAWKASTAGKAFRDAFGELGGDSLKRPPRGFDADHPLVEDLKRKDFVAFCEWKTGEMTVPDLDKVVAKTYAVSNKFMAFICDALGLPF